MRCRRCDHEMEPEYAEYDGWLSPGDADRLLEMLATERKRADRLEKACRLIVEAGQSPPDVFGERFNEAYDSAKSALAVTDKNKGETG